MCLWQCQCTLDTHCSWRRAGRVLKSFNVSLPLPLPFTSSHKFMYILFRIYVDPLHPRLPSRISISNGHRNHAFWKLLKLCSCLTSSIFQDSYPEFPSCLGRSGSAVAKNSLCVFLRDQGPGRNPAGTWGTSKTFSLKLKKGCSLGSEMGKGSCYS